LALLRLSPERIAVHLQLQRGLLLMDYVSGAMVFAIAATPVVVAGLQQTLP
jgi:hypothetical protein